MRRIKLTSIPPANRGWHSSSPLDRISSMRSATRVGMVFVGPRVNQPQPGEETRSNFTPKVVKPDLQVQQIRSEICQGMAEHIAWLSYQLARAEEEGERHYWKAALDNLKEQGYTIGDIGEQCSVHTKEI